MINKLILQFRHNLKPRMGRSWLPMLAILVVVSAFLFVVYQFAVRKGINPGFLTRDPNDVNGAPFYIGIVTDVDLILWSVAASFCFMGAVLLFRKSQKFWFLLSAGLFTTLLVFDDAFELHEGVLPYKFNIPERAVYAVYLIFIMAFLVYFLGTIISETDFPIFGAAILCMAASLLVDQIIKNNVFLEDGFKLLGITFWLAYFSRTAIHMVNEFFRPGLSSQGTDHPLKEGAA